MSEIEIMFNRAGLLGVAEQIPSTGEIIGWKPMPFTAEKQLGILKWLAKLDGHFEISCTYNEEKFILNFYFNRQTVDHHNPAYFYSSNSCDDFAELLATQINELWKDLKEEEKLEIMAILKG